MKNTVFLSYASQDREYAKSLKSGLSKILSVKSQPLEIFDVQSDVAAGEDIRKAIKRAMDAASTVVIVSSPHVDNSQWVNYEAGLADALGKNLVIVARKGSGKTALVNRFRDSAKVIELDDKG
jgi:TIR domain